MGEDDCIPSCNEVSYKIAATTTAKFPGTGTGIETGTDADFTRAARNLLSNLTKNLNHRYKKYISMTKIFWLFYELFFFFLEIGTIWLWSMFSFLKTLFSSTNEMNCMHLKISFVSFINSYIHKSKHSFIYFFTLLLQQTLVVVLACVLGWVLSQLLS